MVGTPSQSQEEKVQKLHDREQPRLLTLGSPGLGASNSAATRP